MRIVFYTILLVALFELPGLAEPPVTAAALAANAQQVVLGSQSGVEIRSWPDLELVKKFATKLAHVHDLKFSPDGRTLLVAGGAPAVSGRVEVWEWSRGELLHEVEPHDDVVYRVAWSPDGSQWSSCGGDGRCIVFNASTAKQIAEYKGHSKAVVSLGYLEAASIVSVSADQTVRLWNSSDGMQLRTLDNHLGTVNDVAVLNTLERQPTSTAISATNIATISEDRTLRLWQPKIGRLVRFVRLPSVPRSLVLSADATAIYVGCNDGVMRVVEVENLQVTREIQGLQGRIHEMVIDPLNEHLLVAGEGGWKMIFLESR